MFKIRILKKHVPEWFLTRLWYDSSFFNSNLQKSKIIDFNYMYNSDPSYYASIARPLLADWELLNLFFKDKFYYAKPLTQVERFRLRMEVDWQEYYWETYLPRIDDWNDYYVYNINFDLINSNNYAFFKPSNFIYIYNSLISTPSCIFLILFLLPVFLYIIFFISNFFSYRQRK